MENRGTFYIVTYWYIFLDGESEVKTSGNELEYDE